MKWRNGYWAVINSLKNHDFVLKFQAIHPGFCVRMERCQVIRGYKPRSPFNINNMRCFIDDIPVRCNKLAFEVPKGRKPHDSPFQVRCEDCRVNLGFTCKRYHMDWVIEWTEEELKKIQPGRTSRKS